MYVVSLAFVLSTMCSVVLGRAMVTTGIQTISVVLGLHVPLV